MRIVENSPKCLRLEESSERLAAFLLAVAVILAIVIIAQHLNPKQLINAFLFAAAAVFFRRKSQVKLDRSARHCEIVRQDMWRQSHQSVPFDNINNVQVEIMRPDTSVQVHSRLSLETSEGALPLTAGYRADLDRHLELREAMVDVIFSGRSRPMPLDAAQLLRDAGRPIAASMHA
jgi:hypothetical protein